MLEIQYYTDSQAGYLQVIDDLATLDIGYAVNGLNFDDHLVEGDKIRNVVANFYVLLSNIEPLLLINRNAPQPEFDHQSILVWLFKQAMPQDVQHLHGTAHDLVHLVL